MTDAEAIARVERAVAGPPGSPAEWRFDEAIRIVLRLARAQVLAREARAPGLSLRPVIAPDFRGEE